MAANDDGTGPRDAGRAEPGRTTRAAAEWSARSYPVLAALAPVITEPDNELAYPGDPMCLYSALGHPIRQAGEARRQGLRPGGVYADLCPDWGESPDKALRLGAPDDGIRPAEARPSSSDSAVFDPRIWTDETREGFRAVLRARQPRVMLISSVSAAHRYALEMAEIAKQESPGCLVVLGGRHADETIRFDRATGRVEFAYSSTVSAIRDGRVRPVVDLLVAGDGPFALDLLMRAVSLAMDLDRRRCAPADVVGALHLLGAGEPPVPGSAVLVALDGPAVHAFPLTGPSYDLTQLPSPYAAFTIRSRFPIFPDPSGRAAAKRTAHMMTAMSCPYRCTFCSESVTVTGSLRRYDGTQVDAAVARMCEHVHYGAEAVFFDDPVFWAGNSRALLGFCEELRDARASGGASLPASAAAWLRDPGDAERLRQLEWGAQLTVDVLITSRDRAGAVALLAAMRDAGCTYLYLGLESMSEEVMAGIHKNRRRENPTPWVRKVRTALELIRASGIRAGTSVLFGLDGENRTSIDTTVDEVGRLLDDGLLELASPNILTYHPAAEITARHGMRDRIDYHSADAVNHPPYTFFEEAYPGVVSRLLTEDDVWYIHERTRDRWGTGRNGAKEDSSAVRALTAGPERPTVSVPAGPAAGTGPMNMTRGHAMTSLAEIRRLAEAHKVPELDVLLIAANSAGARTEMTYPRARMQLRPLRSEESWQVILPLDNPDSPFTLDDKGLSLEGEYVADLVDVENDDVVLTYLRAGGRSITLNTHSRSTCTGCLFCPNVIEDAADATLTTEQQLGDLLEWVRADNAWDDLSEVEVITVCTGCFHTPDAAIDHMAALRRAAGKRGFTGRLHLLSSVVRERRHLERLAEEVAPFHLTLTLECFTRRNLLLKDTKASLTVEKSCEILDTCAELGMLGDFTYVVGLDPLEPTVRGLRQLAPHCSTFPRIQVFQAHNQYMRAARDAEAEPLDYYLTVRNEVEADFAGRGLSPRSWENYRPLWYSRYAGGPVSGPRV